MTTTRVPGSKSITNRALLLAAAARGRSRLRAPLVSDDTVAFREALRALGVRISVRGEDWEIDGLGGAPHTDAGIWCADAGTAARFLPPLLAAGAGSYRIGLRSGGITLDDPDCVAKTFPDFHQELRRVFGATH